MEQGLVHEWDGNYIKYLCTFTNSQSGASFQGYYYDNVDKDKPPTNLNNLYGQFIWSPHEDFVIFPYEVGQDAPGTVQYDILSLNPALPWKDTSARMSMDLTSDSLFWLDSLTAIYNAHNDCDYGVDMFNGHKGEVITIRPSESPVGYNIVGLDSEMVVLITTFDNCIPLEDIKSFQPKIVSIKISTLREKYIH
ncbi:MAG TPA: hypothetical protein VLY03_06760 [Bacteroidota bacterium]|nr:hypothetical protein [Bacteroidota bacterium]